MSLTNEDREALIDAVLDDAARQDGFTVLGPGGTDGNTPTLNEAVEQIVERHVAEALTDLDDRSRQAFATLFALSEQEVGPEADRLLAKASGVALVRDYIRGAMSSP